MALTHADLDHVRALWEERVGPGFSLEVQIVGEHSEEVDQDRPVGVKLTAKLSLRVIVCAVPHMSKNGFDASWQLPIFDEVLPYDRDALLASVRALSGHLLGR